MWLADSRPELRKQTSPKPCFSAGDLQQNHYILIIPKRTGTNLFSDRLWGGKHKCNCCAWGSTHRPFLALGESWSNQGICVHTVGSLHVTHWKQRWLCNGLSSSHCKLREAHPLCALSTEKKHREKWKSCVFLLPFLKQNLPSPFITSRQELTLPAYTFQELQLPVLINSYSRFNEQMGGKVSSDWRKACQCKTSHFWTPTRTQGCREGRGTGRTIRIGRKTCLSLNKFQLLRKRGLRPIFQSRSTVLFRTRNWNQGFMHVRQVSSTELSRFYLLIIIWCLKKLILLLYKVTYKLSSKAHGRVKKKPEQTKNSQTKLLQNQ